MTRRRGIERRIEELEQSMAQRDDALADALTDDVDSDQVDAVIEASQKHLSNAELDESEQRLYDWASALDPV